MIRVGCPRKIASRGPLAELGRTRRRPPLARAFTLKPWQSRPAISAGRETNTNCRERAKSKWQGPAQ
jgi:hypothetical protein